MKKGLFNYTINKLTKLVQFGSVGGYVEYLSNVFTFRRSDNSTLANLKIAEGTEPEHAVRLSQVLVLTPTIIDKFAYDATVGSVLSGADHLTHKLAYAAGARRVAQISDVTETSNSEVSSTYLIEGNGYTLYSDYQFHDRGNPSKYIVASNLNIVVTNYVESFFYTHNRIELYNCTLDHSATGVVGAWNNAGLYPKVNLELVVFKPSSLGTLFNYSSGIISNCSVVGISTTDSYNLFEGDATVGAYCAINAMVFSGVFNTANTSLNVFEVASNTSFTGCIHIGTGVVNVDSPISLITCSNITVNGSLSAVIESEVQNEFTQSINIPLGETYKINNVDILDYVTIGVGGTYATIQLALVAGKYNYKILSSISETVDWPASEVITMYAEVPTSISINVPISLAHNIYARNIVFSRVGVSDFVGGSYINMSSCFIMSDFGHTSLAIDADRLTLSPYDIVGIRNVGVLTIIFYSVILYKIRCLNGHIHQVNIQGEFLTKQTVLSLENTVVDHVVGAFDSWAEAPEIEMLNNSEILGSSGLRINIDVQGSLRTVLRKCYIATLSKAAQITEGCDIHTLGYLNSSQFSFTDNIIQTAFSSAADYLVILNCEFLDQFTLNGTSNTFIGVKFSGLVTNTGGSNKYILCRIYECINNGSALYDKCTFLSTFTDNTTSTTVLNVDNNVLEIPNIAKIGTLTTFEQSLTPTTNVQIIDLFEGSTIHLDISYTTHTSITLAINNAKATATYSIDFVQGLTSKNIIFPLGTKTLNGVGNTVLGVASATQRIIFEYDGTNFIILKTGEIG